MGRFFAGTLMLLFFALILSSADVWAEGSKGVVGKFGLGPRAGYYKSNDADEGNLYFGIQARGRLTPNLAIEGAIDYRKEEFDNGNIVSKSYPILASALLYLLPNSTLSPYIIGGIGWYNTTVEIKGADNETSSDIGYHFGAGADIPIAETVVLNFDIRYNFLDVSVESKDIDYKGWIGTGGLTFYF